MLPCSDSYIKSDLFVNSINDRTSDSFRIVYSLYAPALIRFSSKYLINRCDAEDIIQDVFIEFWQGKSKFSTVEQVRSYLYKATKSHTLNYVKRKKRVVFNISFLENRDSNDMPNNFFDFHNELYSLFDSSLGSLPKECKKIFGFIIKGFSSFEIGQKLDRAPSTIRAQKRRGISLIKEICFRNKRCRELMEN